MKFKISKKKKFRDSVVNFSTTALSFVIFPPKKIKTNHTKIEKKQKIRNMLKKVKFIAKNVIYIKSFSSIYAIKYSKKNNHVIIHHPGSNLLYRHKNFELRLINGDNELVYNAQKLRHKSFFNINCNGIDTEKDKFDSICKHLVVIDKSISDSKVVGTYRLLSGKVLSDHLGFYSASEFNLDPLKEHKQSILEVGRSCVDQNYRNGKIIKMLWKGLTREIIIGNYNFVIGCASFSETDPKKIRRELSYLYHFHTAPKKFDIRAILEKKVEWKIIGKSNINIKEIFNNLPPLIKAYLRVGAWMSGEAVLDKVFKTIDVCVLLKSSNIKKKYLNLSGLGH